MTCETTAETTSQVILDPLSSMAAKLVGGSVVKARTKWLEGLLGSPRQPGGHAAAVKGALNAGIVGFVVKGRHGARMSMGALRFAAVCLVTTQEFAGLSRYARLASLARRARQVGPRASGRGWPSPEPAPLTALLTFLAPKGTRCLDMCLC